MNKLPEHFSRLIEAGIPIFPCTKDKIPALPGNWQDHSTTDPECLLKMLAQRPDAIPAVDLGKAGLVVLDGDRHGGPDGVALLEDLFDKIGLPPETPRIRTANNGRHYIFCQPDPESPMGCSRGGFPVGVDVKGRGGYIIAEGAVLPDGRSWKAEEGSPDFCQSFMDNTIPKLPQHIQDIILNRVKKDNGKLEVINTPVASFSSSYVQTAIDEEVYSVASAVEGCRNETLNRAAYSLGQFVGSGDLSESNITSLLMDAALKSGLSQQEALRTIKSGIDAGRKKPREKNDSGVFQTSRSPIFKADKESQESQESRGPEEPIPLRRELPPPEPYPLDGLGPILEGAAKAIVDKIQCPDAIAAASALATASYAAQSLVDVILPYGSGARPTSLFFVSVAASGDRKSAADSLAIKPIRLREKELKERYDQDIVDYRRAKKIYDYKIAQAEKNKEIETKLLEVGDEPTAPRVPILTIDEPTIEGMHRLFEKGHPSLALFSDEGGSFLSGHAFQKENRLKSIANLSNNWDGAPIRRIRSGDGASVIYGCRLSVHLMMQPTAASLFLADPMAKDQGILSRILACQPTSIAGSRFHKPLGAGTLAALTMYEETLLELLRYPTRRLIGMPNSLDPRGLPFSSKATREFQLLTDEIERQLADGKPYEQIRGFANKLPENIARIAAVLAVVENAEADEINSDCLGRAALLGDFYASEALRQFEASHITTDIVEAEKLLFWLQNYWPESNIALVPIYQRGPNSIRTSSAAKKAIKTLENHGWLTRTEDKKPVVDGKAVREAWRIHGKEK